MSILSMFILSISPISILLGPSVPASLVMAKWAIAGGAYPFVTAPAQFDFLLYLGYFFLQIYLFVSASDHANTSVMFMTPFICMPILLLIKDMHIIRLIMGMTIVHMTIPGECMALPGACMAIVHADIPNLLDSVDLGLHLSQFFQHHSLELITILLYHSLLPFLNDHSMLTLIFLHIYVILHLLIASIGKDSLLLYLILGVQLSVPLLFLPPDHIPSPLFRVHRLSLF